MNTTSTLYLLDFSATSSTTSATSAFHGGWRVFCNANLGMASAFVDRRFQRSLQTLCPDLASIPNIHQHRHSRLASRPCRRYRYSPTPDIVIETFVCELPDNAQSIIHQDRPLWLNWEYLSAGRQQREAALNARLCRRHTEIFLVYGFQRKSGGLLRERDYAESAGFDTEALRQQLKLPAKTRPSGCWLSKRYLGKWLTMWQQAGQPITLLLAGTQIIASLKTAA